eukprot:GHVQ01006064.1.p1 GENE.GHVQ01006064.1~~GHVQ01006064.1.p1  ORF type:complete len:141 (+),score=10.27 GHVQ01006064.1:244-666(+)
MCAIPYTYILYIFAFEYILTHPIQHEEGEIVEGDEESRSGKKMGRRARRERASDGTMMYHVLLITCAVTRAVHLEVLRTMETKEILWALRRFVAVRGKPDKIISDNALQFLLLGKVTGSQLNRMLPRIGVRSTSLFWIKV